MAVGLGRKARMVILQKRVAGTNEQALDRFVARAKRAVGLRGAVTVLVTTSRELRALNARFRGKDKPTDVLSFPARVTGERRFIGDVAISADLAAQSARRLGHSTVEEVKILALHGVLHLAGYDHEVDHGEMAQRELELRKELRLPVALIERNGSQRFADRGRSTARRTSSGKTSSASRSLARRTR
jgi:probable rRNA maturation factor